MTEKWSLCAPAAHHDTSGKHYTSIHDKSRPKALAFLSLVFCIDFGFSIINKSLFYCWIQLQWNLKNQTLIAQYLQALTTNMLVLHVRYQWYKTLVEEHFVSLVPYNECSFLSIGGLLVQCARNCPVFPGPQYHLKIFILTYMYVLFKLIQLFSNSYHNAFVIMINSKAVNAQICTTW